jgi:hypothetical protein
MQQNTIDSHHHRIYWVILLTEAIRIAWEIVGPSLKTTINTGADFDSHFIIKHIYRLSFKNQRIFL